MANCVGYEELRVGGTAVGPTASIAVPHVRCAVFYLDPDAASSVRYRPDGTDPTVNKGIPIRPGHYFVVAGYGDVINSKFISTSNRGDYVAVHALYYDQVDIVDLGLLPTTTGTSTGASKDYTDLLVEILGEMRGMREDFTREIS